MLNLNGAPWEVTDTGDDSARVLNQDHRVNANAMSVICKHLPTLHLRFRGM
ncbi:MAG: hypothetical protein IIB61_01920 [Planctomycetes bacterium]|nr:hypothetical protein [Planctomycetota bacterium]